MTGWWRMVCSWVTPRLSNDDVYLDAGHPWLISIGDDTTLGPGVVILAHDASMRRHIGRTLLAPVVIGRRVFVGARAVILPGASIGDDCIVGAGAVVLPGEIPARSVVVGNPARIVGDVEAFAQRHRQAASHAPAWPHEGWMRGRGITEERMRAQRQALATRGVGYLVGSELAESEDSPGSRCSGA